MANQVTQINDSNWARENRFNLLNISNESLIFEPRVDKYINFLDRVSPNHNFYQPNLLVWRLLCLYRGSRYWDWIEIRLRDIYIGARDNVSRLHSMRILTTTLLINKSSQKWENDHTNWWLMLSCTHFHRIPSFSSKFEVHQNAIWSPFRSLYIAGDLGDRTSRVYPDYPLHRSGRLLPAYQCDVIPVFNHRKRRETHRNETR